jgi:hypothetical protein
MKTAPVPVLFPQPRKKGWAADGSLVRPPQVLHRAPGRVNECRYSQRRENPRHPRREFFSAIVGLRGRKEVAQMKTIKPLLSVLLLSAAVGLSVSPAEAPRIISKFELGRSGYCHLKFPAIQEKTLGAAHPVLKDADSGDIIDFYGSCDHDPLGKEEIWAQKLDHKRRMMLNRE